MLTSLEIIHRVALSSNENHKSHTSNKKCKFIECPYSWICQQSSITSNHWSNHPSLNFRIYKAESLTQTINQHLIIDGSIMQTRCRIMHTQNLKCIQFPSSISTLGIYYTDLVLVHYNSSLFRSLIDQSRGFYWTIPRDISASKSGFDHRSIDPNILNRFDAGKSLKG